MTKLDLAEICPELWDLWRKAGSNSPLAKKIEAIKDRMLKLAEENEIKANIISALWVLEKKCRFGTNRNIEVARDLVEIEEIKLRDLLATPKADKERTP